MPKIERLILYRSSDLTVMAFFFGPVIFGIAMARLLLYALFWGLDEGGWNLWIAVAFCGAFAFVAAFLVMTYYFCLADEAARDHQWLRVRWLRRYLRVNPIIV